MATHTFGEEGDPLMDRPWVYFMIDAFFLCTQFFVVTFKIKSDEVVLPQKLPPGGYVPRIVTDDFNKRKLSVHVSQAPGSNVATYRYMQREVDFQSLVQP